MSEFWRRLRILFGRAQFNRDADEEMRFHLEMQAEENRENGMRPEEAHYAARRQFGNPALLKETSREVWGWGAVERFVQDLKHACRVLRKSPGFTATAVATLALGIGANTAVFSVVNAVLLRPLRFPGSDRLMVLSELQPHESNAAPGVFLDWRDRSRSFERMSAARSTRKILTGLGQPRFCDIAAAGFDFFEMLGVAPVLGRIFTRGEDQPGRDTVALLSAGFWRRELAADPNVLGRAITLDGRTYTIAGVLPQGFRFAYFGAPEIWLPLAADRRFRGGGDLVVVGRLKPDVTREAAQAEMDAVMRGIAREHEEDSRSRVAITPLRQWMVGDVRTALLALLGAVVLVLLIACANLATVLMARAAARRTEIAVRASLGAGWPRLLRQMLVESTLLGTLGGACGLLLAWWAVQAVPSIRTFHIPRGDEIKLDGAMLAFAASLSIATGIVFGLAPAWEARRTDLSLALKSGARAAQPCGSGFRSALVIAQLALTLILVSGAALLLDSFVRLLHIDLGLRPDNVLTIGLNLPYQKYDAQRRLDTDRQLMDRVRHLPGVQQVSAADYVALQAVLFPYELRVDGGGDRRTCVAQARHVAPHYFQVMGIPLRQGRGFEWRDDIRQPIPTVINETLARLLFREENPIGRRLATNYSSRPVLLVVGVAGNARQLGLRQEPGPQIYLPVSYGSAHYVVARTGSDPRALMGSIRAVAREIAPDAPEPDVGTLQELLDGCVAQPRFYLLLLGSFAALALLLGAVGVYGTVSYAAAQRTHEIGVRIALGAARGDVVLMILRQALALTVAGVGLGLAGAWASTRVLSSLLFRVRPNDSFALACASLLLIAVGLAAGYLPARRAARVDPMAALRRE